jgi:TPR repeat protein
LEWYSRAAEAGSAEAMGNIALIYEEGKGVKMDMEKANEWYSKSNRAKGTIK